MRSVFLILFALFATHARAEPTKTISWLMNEPMSLFDWGIYQTEKKLEELKLVPNLFSGKVFAVFAQYDWDANRIRLRVLFEGTGTDSECLENLRKAKGAFLEYTWEDKEQQKKAPQVLRSLFSHHGGYQSKSSPSDYGDELAKVAVMEASILVRAANGSYSPKSTCSTDFRSAAVNILKQ